MKMNPSINLLHSHSNLFLMLVIPDLQLRQESSTSFCSIRMFESSSLIILHLDLQEMLAYVAWLNHRTEPSATIRYTYMAHKNMMYRLLNLVTYSD